MHPSYLCHVEAGRREPSIKLLRSMAQELDVPPGLLLAITLAAELPPESRGPYTRVLEELLELARYDQFGLPFLGKTDGA